jgi:hypothetical protein
MQVSRTNELKGGRAYYSIGHQSRSTTISTRNVISSPAKSTNRDFRLRWLNGAQSWRDPHLQFLSRQTHPVVHRSRFCLTRPPFSFVGLYDPPLYSLRRN